MTVEDKFLYIPCNGEPVAISVGPPPEEDIHQEGNSPNASDAVVTPDDLAEATELDWYNFPINQFIRANLPEGSFYIAVPYQRDIIQLAEFYSVNQTNFKPEDFSFPTSDCQVPFEELLESARYATQFKTLVLMLEYYGLPDLNNLPNQVRKDLFLLMLIGSEPQQVAYQDYRVSFSSNSDITTLFRIDNMKETLLQYIPESSRTPPQPPEQKPNNFISLFYNGSSKNAKGEFLQPFRDTSETIRYYSSIMAEARGRASVDGRDLAIDATLFTKNGRNILEYLEKQSEFDPLQNYLIVFSLSDGLQLQQVYGYNELLIADFNEGVLDLDSELSDRDKFYLSNIEELASLDRSRVTLTQFIQWYVFLAVSPSADPPEPNGAKERASRAALDALDRKYGTQVRNLRSCAAGTWNSFQDLKDSFTPPPGSTKESRKAARKARRDAFKNGLNRKINEEFGDLENQLEDRFGDGRKLAEDFKAIKNIDQVFINFFDRIPLAVIADALLGCFGGIDLDLGCQPLKLPRFPGFQLPDIPTVDIMADLGPLLLESLINALVQALIDAIASMLENLLAVCGVSYDIDSTIRGTEQNKLNSLLDDIRERDLVELIKFICGFDNSFVTSENRTQYLTELRSALTDISGVLSATELCSLFEGQGSDKDLTLVREIIKNKYPTLFDCMRDKNSIARFFNKLGFLIDSNYCRSVARQIPNVEVPLYSTSVGDGQKTPEDFANEGAYDSIVEDALAGSSCYDASGIDDIVNKGKERRETIVRRARKVATIFKAISNGEAGVNDLVYALESDEECPTTPGRSVEDSLLARYAPLQHPTVDFLLFDFIESLFVGIKQAEYGDAKDVVDLFVYDEKQNGRTKIYFKSGPDVEPRLTPTIKKLQIEGHPVDEAIDEMKEAISDDPGGIDLNEDPRNFYEHEKGVPTAAPGVKKSLQSLDNPNPKNTLDLYSYNLDNESLFYQLQVKSDPTALEAVQKFFDNFTEILNNADADVDLSSFGGQQKILQLLDPQKVQEAIPKWNVRYKMPYADLSSNLFSIKDEYEVEIFSDYSFTGDVEYLKKTVSLPLNQQLTAYVDSLSLYKSPLIVKDVSNLSSSVDEYAAPYNVATFGNYVGQRWSSAIKGAWGSNSITSAELLVVEKFSENLSKYFASSVHAQASNDIFSLIGNEIASSLLFKNRVVEYGAFGNKEQGNKPWLSNLNLLREPTAFENACDIRPSPIRTGCFEREIKELIKNSACGLADPVTFGDPTTEDTLTVLLLKTLTKMTVRAYVYDCVLRMSFVLTQFKIEDAVDDYIIEFLYKKMFEEIKSYTQDTNNENCFVTTFVNGRAKREIFNYYNELCWWANCIYRDDNELEPITRQEFDPECDCKVGMKYLIERSFENVAREIRSDIQNSIPGAISQNLKTPKRYLIENWIPTIDVQRQTDNDSSTLPSSTARFFNPDIEIGVSDSLEPFIGSLEESSIFKINSENKIFVNGREVNFDLNNGNFLFERYIKVVRRNPADIIQKLQQSLGAEYSNFVEEVLSGFNQGIQESNIEGSFSGQVGYNTRHFPVNEFNKIWGYILHNITTRISTLSTSLGLPKTAQTPWGVKREILEKAIVFENFFELVQPGKRLIYLLPIEDGLGGNNIIPSGELSIFDLKNNFSNTYDSSLQINETTFTDIPELSDYTNSDYYFSEAVNSISSSEQSVRDKYLQALATLRRSENAYSVLEKISLPSLVNTIPDPNDPLSNITPPEQTFREIYPIPLVDTTEACEISWWKRNKGRYFLEGPASASAYWSTTYLTEGPALNDAIENSTEFDLLFNYCLPVDRYLALLSVYTIISASSIPNISLGFIGTKDSLYDAFKTIAKDCSSLDNQSIKIAGNCWEIDTVDQAEFRRCLLNQEYGFQSPCFSFGFGIALCLPEFRGLGFDVALKLALKTPLLLFKGFTEAFDPNIKLAKWIYDFLKALGICIPLPLISFFGLLPSNVFAPIGFGPPLTIFGFGYLGLLFESFLDLLFDELGLGEDPTAIGITGDDCLDYCNPPIY